LKQAFHAYRSFMSSYDPSDTPYIPVFLVSFHLLLACFCRCCRFLLFCSASHLLCLSSSSSPVVIQRSAVLCQPRSRLVPDRFPELPPNHDPDKPAQPRKIPCSWPCM
jgi:hypothetical protein